MNKLSKAGFVMANFAMAYLVYLLLAHNLPLNLATWMLWLTIDFTVILSLRRAKQPIELMMAFLAWTGIIVLISTYNYGVGKATFTFGYPEMLAVVAVIIALVVWKYATAIITRFKLKQNADAIGVIMTTLAMVIAGIPTWINTYYDPTTASVLFWSLGGGGCFLTWLGSARGERFMPLSGWLSNGVIVILALRQFA